MRSAKIYYIFDSEKEEKSVQIKCIERERRRQVHKYGKHTNILILIKGKPIKNGNNMIFVETMQGKINNKCCILESTLFFQMADRRTHVVIFADDFLCIAFFFPINQRFYIQNLYMQSIQSQAYCSFLFHLRQHFPCLLLLFLS